MVFSTLDDNLIVNTVLDNGHVKCSWEVKELNDRKERQQEVILICLVSAEHNESSAVHCLWFKTLTTIATR